MFNKILIVLNVFLILFISVGYIRFSNLIDTYVSTPENQELVLIKEELKQLECDLGSAFFAEREYTYPILRSLGYNPDNYGKGIKNPLTSEVKYNLHRSNI